MVRTAVYKRFLIALGLLIGLHASAQTTRISGSVTDAKTGETLPFVNIAFIDSRIGTTSDMEGKYAFETYYATDSIRASFVGYLPRTFPVKKDKAQVVDIALQPSSVELTEVIIRPPDENPAFTILRRVVQHKPTNNREKLEAYNYEAYNKVEFDLNNITEEFTQKKLFKPFAFIFENIDSTDSKPYLPIFMTETLSDVYYRQQPKTRKEFIHGTKVSGVENESVSQFMGDMYQNVNIYDNFLVIFGRNFVSPIADGGKGFYDYDLTDSAYVGKYWCYKLEFKPKRVQELAFKGEMWINDTTYAVHRIEAGIAQGANLNFVESFKVQQEYEQVQNEVWMLTKDELVVDLNAKKDTGKPNKNKVQGLYGRRTATYQNFEINAFQSDEFYSGAEEVVMDIAPLSLGADYWDTHRHVPLSAKEYAIYHMVDTMKSIPRFRTYLDIVNTVVTGYYPLNYLELGPYFTIYSFNPVEGHRFRMGARTSSLFSKTLEFEAYGAYGTKDQEFKFSFGGRGFISKEPRMILGAYFKRDIEQLGQSTNAFRQDNILSSAFRRTPNNKLTLVDEYRVQLEREWFMGFSSSLMLLHRTLYARGTLAYVGFDDERQPQLINSITTAEVVFGTRFAFKEKYVSGDFTRVSLGTRFPVLSVQYTHGFKGLLNGAYDYTNLLARVQQRVQVGALGFFRYTLTTGKVFGTLPYPLLIIHAGNETFYNTEGSFNTMNFFEFISDRFVSGELDHHFDGLFFNRVPFFRKLKWREVVGAKAVWGSLDDKNRNEMELLPFMYDLSGGPFVEVSAGIENIFKFIRVDAVRRIAYLDHPNTKLWAFRFMMNVTF